MLSILKQLVEGATSDNLKAMIFLALEEHGDLSLEEIGIDSVSLFQGVCIGVTVQLKQIFGPFIIGVHFMSHMINMAMHTLIKLPQVAKIEDMLQSLYTYFSHSNKRSREHADLVDIMEVRVNRLLCNVKTCWISILAFAKCVHSESRALLLKMYQDEI